MKNQQFLQILSKNVSSLMEQQKNNQEGIEKFNKSLKSRKKPLSKKC